MPEATFAMKRAYPRFPFSADAEVRLRDGTSLAAEILELSRRGCFLDALTPIPVGTELQLRISNGMSVCELPAKVIYMQPGYGMGIFGMGIVFETVTAEHHAAVESLLRDRGLQQAQNCRN
jgi:PilZ domain